jgi:2-methylisocitrate lyase-like PEP mutase family enzyme
VAADVAPQRRLPDHRPHRRPHALGLDEALRRAEAYAQGRRRHPVRRIPETEDEMRRIGRSFDQPLLANMVEGGRTPVLSAARAGRHRLQDRHLPRTALLAATQAMQAVYDTLKAQGVGRPDSSR